jgi:hypothetical protein
MRKHKTKKDQVCEKESRERDREREKDIFFVALFLKLEYDELC